MHSIFKRRFKEFTIRVQSVIEKAPKTRKMALDDVVRSLNDNPVNMLRFPAEEIRDLVNVPCPGIISVILVKNPIDPNSLSMIRSFKKLRDYYGISEESACSKCPLLSKCPNQFKVPNLQKNAGVQDVFNVLLAYTDLSLTLESISNKYNLTNIIKESSPIQAEDEKELQQIKLYNLRYRNCLIALNGLDSMIHEFCDLKEEFFLEKFTNAVKEFEYGQKHDVGEKIVQKFNNNKSPAIKESFTLPQRDMNQSPQSREEKKAEYLRKLDDGVDSKPRVDREGRKLAKEKVREKSDYVDQTKKKSTSMINMHFLKESKYNLSPSTQRLRTDAKVNKYKPAASNRSVSAEESSEKIPEPKRVQFEGKSRNQQTDMGKGKMNSGGTQTRDRPNSARKPFPNKQGK